MENKELLNVAICFRSIESKSIVCCAYFDALGYLKNETNDMVKGGELFIERCGMHVF